MADLKAKAFTSAKKYGSNDATIDLTATRDGALYTAEYRLNKGMEGRVFTVSSATALTAVNFVAIASYAATTPQLVVDVPIGKIIVPLRITVHFSLTGGVLQTAHAVIGTNNVGAGTSTA